jgi:hypothetical protein
MLTKDASRAKRFRICKASQKHQNQEQQDVPLHALLCEADRVYRCLKN